jgi:hypothetical protein
MDWEFIAPMVIMVVATLTVGGVLVLRPLTKRFAELMQHYVSDRKEGPQAELRNMRELLETMDARLQLLEDRLDFTERLLEPGEGSSRRDRERLAPPEVGHDTGP